MRPFVCGTASLLLTSRAMGFASWFAQEEQYCGREMKAGEIIMNNAVEPSEDRSVQLFRGSESMVSGASYLPGETLTVVLSDVSAQFVIETTAGAFEEGGCNGRRVISSPAKLTMPSDGSSDVRIWAGWAFGHSTVMISSSVVLKGSGAVPEEKAKASSRSKSAQEASSLRGAMKALRAQAHNLYFQLAVGALGVVLFALIVYKFYFKFKFGKRSAKGV